MAAVTAAGALAQNLKRWDTLIRLIGIQATQAKMAFDLTPPTHGFEQHLEPTSKFSLLFNTLHELHSLPFTSVFEEESSGDDVFEEFKSWLQKNGCDLSKLQLKEGLTEGNGILAGQELKEGDLVVKIPKKLMLTTETALEIPAISKLLETDQVVKTIPNLLLALQLLHERGKKNSSFWAPYLRILPRSYQTVFYMDREDLAALRGSPILAESLRIITTNALQYSRLARLIKESDSWSFGEGEKGKVLTWSDWIWAMSALASRQNPIPSAQGGKAILGLIPVFDMFNHVSSGKITSFFNSDDNMLECHALRDFKTGEQVYIFYGERPNSDFLLFSGFVVGHENEHDFYRLRLNLNTLPVGEKDKKKQEQVLESKRKALESGQLGVSFNSPPSPPSSDGKQPLQLVDFRLKATEGVGEDLLRFARLWVLEDAEQVQGFKGSPALSAAHEDLALAFVREVCTSLLSKYPTSVTEDEHLLSKEVSSRRRQVIGFRLTEKKLLEKVVAKLNLQLQKRKKQQNKRKTKKKGAAAAATTKPTTTTTTAN